MHLFENFAACYNSQADIEVAASLRTEIIGTYPRFNIGAKLELRSDKRLASISTAKRVLTKWRILELDISHRIFRAILCLRRAYEDIPLPSPGH